MSREDKQVIDMANSSAERLERQVHEREEALRCAENTRKRIRQQKQKRQREVLLRMIPALIFILAGLVLLAMMTTDYIGAVGMPCVGGIVFLFGMAGGSKLTAAARR